MTIDYYVRSERHDPSTAKILKQHAVAGVIQREQNGASLSLNDGTMLKMSQLVDGELRPFSMLVEKMSTPGSSTSSIVVLKIRDHLFSHNGKMYMLSNVPEGRPTHHAIRGPKFISRLDNFPYSDPSDVDPQTRNRLRRHRGVPVGEISGLGHKGHLVRIEKELEAIGPELAASAFLLYTTSRINTERIRN